MKITEPKVELLSEIGISTESHIARCSRICYGHEDKEPNQEADKKMVDGLIKRGHLSMLRHRREVTNEYRHAFSRQSSHANGMVGSCGHYSVAHLSK